MQIVSFLGKYNNILIQELETNYKNILQQFKCKNWQYFGNEIGQFNELIYRIIEEVTLGNFTPLNSKLNPLNNNVLEKWENSKICQDDTFRLIIPRVLYSMYCLRNKRGMIHKSDIVPNEMDANLLLANVKWILCELIRKSASTNFDEAKKIIDNINVKDMTFMWEIDGRMKILKKASTREKILIYLYYNTSMKDVDLQNIIQYKNKTNFVKILKKLEDDNMIDYFENKVTISPIGINFIEEIMSK